MNREQQNSHRRDQAGQPSHGQRPGGPDWAWHPGTRDPERGGAESSRGHGPKGYTRSDARLKEMICEKLTDDDEIDARGISVEVSDGEVLLSGTVSERRTKHQVEELVADCGITEIDNQLRVGRQEPRLL